MAKANSKRYFRKHTSARTGVTTYTVTVRIKGFDSVSKTFPTKAAAADWAATQEQTLLEQKERKATPRPDMGRLSVRDLMLEWLADPETQIHRSYEHTHQMASWWIENYGALQALEFNAPLTLREARGKLMRGRAAGTVNRYFVVARRAWNWALENEIVPDDRLWPRGLMLTEPD